MWGHMDVLTQGILIEKKLIVREELNSHIERNRIITSKDGVIDIVLGKKKEICYFIFSSHRKYVFQED